MYAPLAIIHPLTLIQRKRYLPVPGHILVRQNQEVSPFDVVAETDDSLTISIGASKFEITFVQLGFN